LLNPINAPFYRVESFVLPSRHHNHICKLLERAFDLGNTLIHILKFCPHSEEGRRSRDNEADRG
jgi:hypothetical protein